MSAKVNNTTELAKFMRESEADPHHYSIYPDENFFYDTVCYICPRTKRYYVCSEGKGWEIGIYERGSSHHVHHYDTEAEACQGFLKNLYPELLIDEK